eukprot:TRINITY_DN26987_c0_g1_i2.p1 TRINITY_DN26987_c0_g1~~TRINITY_DN26987_c0_g1_i2.p1  ORF type:complete len:530 (+),score=36.01 TRINITY_DN26987_c0_g1_i2:27-1616(+)
MKQYFEPFLIGSPALNSKWLLQAIPSIRCVDGLAGLRTALYEDAQKLSQSARSSKKCKSKKGNANASNNSHLTWGYIIDLDGHWATVFCCAPDLCGITAVLFDTLDVQADAEGLYHADILQSLGEETSSKFSISFKLLLLAPVSEFRREPLPVSAASKATEAQVKGKHDASRLYLSRDCFLPYRRVVIQPVLQASRDDTCLARGVAVLLWLFGLASTNDNLKSFYQFLGKAHGFQMDIAARGRDLKQCRPCFQADGFVKGPLNNKELEMSPHTDNVHAHEPGAADAPRDLSDTAIANTEQSVFEPASRLIAADGSPDRFDRKTHCMVQSLPDTARWNEAICSHIADSEHCRRRQLELGKKLDLSLNVINLHDAYDRTILEAAVEHWNNLKEEETEPVDSRDIDLDFSQVSSHSCLVEFLLYGRLQRVRSLPAFKSVQIPFSVIPFPKLFERLKLHDFFSESPESDVDSKLRAFLLQNEIPENHWGVAVSDFELGGGNSEPEFWNSLSVEKQVRPPRKLDAKAKHRGARR